MLLNAVGNVVRSFIGIPHTMVNGRHPEPAVVVGDEWQEGELTVRDLRTGHEERVGVDMIVEHLRGLRG